MKRSANDALRDSLLLLATGLYLSVSLRVNRRLVVMDECHAAQVNTNVKGIWPSCVDSTEHSTASAPLCDTVRFVIAHQIISTAMQLHWF